MKKTIITIALLGAVTAARAQDGGPDDEGFSKQVEVTREYTPDVEQARKLDFAPRMGDTVALRPQVDYSIRPVAGRTEPAAVPIPPARLAYGAYRQEKPFLLEARGGWPGQSRLNFYGSTGDRATFDAGFALNHRGEYAARNNSLGVESDALTLVNGVRGFAEKRFGRLRLHARAGYDNRLYDAYGAFVPAGVRPSAADLAADAPRIGYGRARASLWFGHSMNDLSHFAFRIGVDGGYFYDNGNAGQTDYRARLMLGKTFGKHTLTLDASYRGISGSGGIGGYENNTVFVSPRYRLETGRVTLGIGLDYLYDQQAESLHTLLPTVRLEVETGKGRFVPYLSIAGTVEDGSYGVLTLRNPYIEANEWTGDWIAYESRIGFSGHVGSVLSYDVSTGLDFFNAYPVFANYYRPGNSSRFISFADDIMMWVVGLDLEAQLARGLSLRVEGKVRPLAGREADDPGAGFSLFNLGGTLEYRFEDRFSVALGVEGTGKTYYMVCGETTPGPALFTDIVPGSLYSTARQETVPAAVNISLRADVRLARNLWLYVVGDNLADREIWYLNHYRAMGINASAGLRFAF